TTRADSVANMTTAHFCSGGAAPASTAFFLLDLPAGSSGKLKLVALDPSDPVSLRVAQSPEVTFNGGATGPYPPVLLLASSTHLSGTLAVTAVGAGLLAAQSV